MNELIKTENPTSKLLEEIFEESKNLYSKKNTPKKLSTKLKKAAKILRLDNEIQSVIIAILYDFRVKDENVTNKDLANHLGCNVTDLTGVRHQINKLFFKSMVIKMETTNNRYLELEKSFFYYILFDELETFYKSLEVKGIHAFFSSVNTMANSFITIAKDDTIFKKEEYYEVYLIHFSDSLKVNKNEKIIQKLEKIDYPNDFAKLLMYYLVYCLTFQGMDAFNISNLLSVIFPIGKELSELKEFFTSKGSILFQLGLVEPIKSDYSNGSIKFTKTFITNYLSDDKELCKFLPEPNVEFSEVLKPVNIKTKKLFYNKAEGEKIDILTKAFKTDNLNDLMKRLESSGFNQGMTVLFHGFPGTGKTETVMQLAKLTGRAVMHVDFSELRDMYVGNSEKNLKAVFDSYYSYIDKTQEIPILLFNEADSIISKRITNIKGGSDQMNNTLQNILLQEMENFKGIMIATTNLINNIDTAFDRRFLYKVPFNKPDSVNRAKMWSNRNKWLKKISSKLLAEKYEFTGGQIENVTKKYLIDAALLGEKNDPKILEKYCEEEEFRLNSKKTNKIFKGFTN